MGVLRPLPSRMMVSSVTAGLTASMTSMETSVVDPKRLLPESSALMVK